MTVPNSKDSQSHQDNQGGFWRYFNLRRLIKKKIEEAVEQIIRQEIRESLNDKVNEHLSKFDIDKKLDDIVENFTNTNVIKAQKLLGQNVDEINKDIDKEVTKLKEETNARVAEQINKIIRASRIYDNIEPQLSKIRAIVILIPGVLIGFSVFFADRIKDIMDIDVLRTEIEHLQEDMKSSQPNGLPAGSSVCSPGDETCCSSEEGFFSC
ncbi:MAG: hypothetical protein TQ37_08895 [Candidatus Synechococcus spongiarum 15L]|uniref:Uncharacterized protein n=1 Tax=Candidatus Synechococcus spongiarum 15L TaxID=1608419 RepID=A0A0G8AS08_9SYNE|nr:MAG: hypothetical protein TQ37_08895 [Candidatus Synechococcus spongiarum 15L]